MNIQDFNKNIEQSTTELRAITPAIGAPFSASTRDRVQSVASHLLPQLRQFEKNLAYFGETAISTADWTEVGKKIENFESALNEATDHLEKEASLASQELIDRLDEVKHIANDHLHAFQDEIKGIHQEITNKIPQLISELALPPKEEVSDEVARLMRLATELKGIKARILSLPPKDLEKNLELKEAIKTIDSARTQIQHKLEDKAPAKVRAEEASHRNELKKIREKAKEQVLDGSASGAEITYQISKGIRDFVANLYNEGIAKLGPPPCRFCLVALGSLARGESGPFPDVDNMLIIEKKTDEALYYFATLNQSVADQVWRLGESDRLGRPGIRFCPGGISTEYLTYDFRYIDNPREAYLSSLEGKEKEELTEAYIRRNDLLDSIQEIKKKIALSPTSSLESKLKALQDELEDASDHLERLKDQAYGGTKELTVSPDESDALLGLGQKNERLDFLRSVLTDSLPIFGDSNLYKEYMALRATSGGAATPSKEADEAKNKRIEKLIRETVTSRLDQEAVNPVLSFKLPELIHVKFDLYRLPQLIVSYLAQLNGLKETNTIDRIQTLANRGVLDQAFARKLIKAMNELYKLRVLSQAGYGEEYELFSTGTWESFSAYKKQVEEELAELHKSEPEMDDKIKQCKESIEALTEKVSVGDDAVRKTLADQEDTLRTLFRRRGKINFYKELLDQQFKKVEKQEYRKADPSNALAKLKEAVIPEQQMSVLKKETIPVLRELFEMTKKSVEGDSLDVSAFRKP